jgi:APA family basic amino acid/polyamine antiporter
VAFAALGTVQAEGMTPWAYLASHKETALVEVAKKFFVGGGIMLLVGGIISTMSALNATIFSSSRVAFAMGRDRNFPGFFGRVHKKNFTPHLSIVFSLFLVVLMAVSLPIEDVASAADIMFLLLFLQVNITLIRLRKKRPDLDRGFFAPLFPYLSILGIALLLFLALYMFNYSPVAWAVAAVWIVCGLFMYGSYASKREIEHVRKIRLLGRLERQDYRILIPLANGRTVESLARIAEAIARKHNGEVLFLHVNEVREHAPLIAGTDDTAWANSLFEKAQSFLAESSIPTKAIVNVSHRISQGILDTAMDEECNFIVVGREKDPGFMERMFSSIIDSVIAKAPCEVAVLHGQIVADRIKTILIPFGSDIHTLLATEVAPAFIDYFNCRVRIVLVFEPDVTPPEKEERERAVRDLMARNALQAELKILHNVDILRGILSEARDADMILMGGRSGDFLELFLGRSLAQEITEQSPCPVLWVKEYEEREPLWKLLLKPLKKPGDKDE